jgi:hypothetical protein
MIREENIHDFTLPLAGGSDALSETISKLHDLKNGRVKDVISVFGGRVVSTSQPQDCRIAG